MAGHRQVLAAVDLGSNSFHMVVARVDHGHLTIIDRLREMVRLGGGLDEHGRIRKQAADRALACLARFGQRLADMHAESVRAVGTNALRKAKNAGEFLVLADAALGFPIEIVSGREEARLVYLGAVHSLPDAPSRRLVVDIGGGSTEIIVGDGVEPRDGYSLYMGCVSMTAEKFASGKLSAKRFRRARLAAMAELEPVLEPVKWQGWDQAIGTSGTIRSVRNVLRELGYADDLITPEGLDKLVARIVDCGRIEQLALPGLSPERAPVYAGGVAVLQAVFESLGVESMRVSDGALREGLLFDMLGRMSDHDARDRSVRSLMRRYSVGPRQAERVEALAGSYLSQVADAWELDDPLVGKLLSWAALIHEIGLDIAHASYHKHGAYVVQNADLPGFSQREQTWLARMVLEHRRKIVRSSFSDLPEPWNLRLMRATVLLRLAVVMCRSRSSLTVPELRLVAQGNDLLLSFPEGWLVDHPLTRADLTDEAERLAAIKVNLAFR